MGRRGDGEKGRWGEEEKGIYRKSFSSAVWEIYAEHGTVKNKP